MSKEPTQASRLLSKLPNARVLTDVERWQRAFKEAETKAKQKEGLKDKLYIINYRFTASEPKKKSEADERRRKLIEVIESLKLREKHISTSSYVISTPIQNSGEVSKLLSGPLDEKLDALFVCHVGVDRTKIGNADLKS